MLISESATGKRHINNSCQWKRCCRIEFLFSDNSRECLRMWILYRRCVSVAKIFSFSHAFADLVGVASCLSDVFILLHRHSLWFLRNWELLVVCCFVFIIFNDVNRGSLLSFCSSPFSLQSLYEILEKVDIPAITQRMKGASQGVFGARFNLGWAVGVQEFHGVDPAWGIPLSCLLVWTWYWVL